MPNEEMGQRALPEAPEVDSAVVLVTVGGFLLFVAISMLGIYLYLRAGAPDALRQATERPFPQPVLQKAPQNDLAQYEAEQRGALSSYSWIDRERGIVKIPIGDAMRIIAKRGDHAYDPLEQASPSGITVNPRGVPK